jgi:hypothetical protein
MKKFNLFKEIITAKKSELIQAINSGKTFGINYKGEIKTPPYSEKEVLIFEGKHEARPVSALAPASPIKIADLFGKNYQIVEDDERVLIKAFSNWQTLIGLNTPRSSYDDTTADGVAEFSNSKLEDIGWQATEFNINYRNIVEEMEAKCEGITLCIEQEEPQYQFSGLGFIFNDDEAEKIVFEFAKNHVQHMIETHEDFERENLTDDEEDAAKFFGLLQESV